MKVRDTWKISIPDSFNTFSSQSSSLSYPSSSEQWLPCVAMTTDVALSTPPQQSNRRHKIITIATAFHGHAADCAARKAPIQFETEGGGKVLNCDLKRLLLLGQSSEPETRGNCMVDAFQRHYPMYQSTIALRPQIKVQLVRIVNNELGF